MSEEIENMCGRISLTEEEKEGISVTKGEIADGRKKGELCLVGRIWSEKLINKEAFKIVLSRVWRIAGRKI